MEKPTTASGAAFRTCSFENLCSNAKKSIKRVSKGEACRARSVESGRPASLGSTPGMVCGRAVGDKMRCGKNEMSVQ